MSIVRFHQLFLLYEEGMEGRHFEMGSCKIRQRWKNINKLFH